MLWVTVEADSGVAESGLGCWRRRVPRKVVVTVGFIAWAVSRWRSCWLIKAIHGTKISPVGYRGKPLFEDLMWFF